MLFRSPGIVDNVALDALENALFDTLISYSGGSQAELEPNIAVGPDRVVTEGSLVTLEGRAHHPFGLERAEWFQDDGPYVQLTQDLPEFLDSTTTTQASFVAPSVEGGPLQLRFIYDASGNGNSAWDSVTITVDDVAEKDRKSTRLNSSHSLQSRMPSSA